MNKQLLKASTPLASLIRWKGYKYPGGIRYPGGITYYPRYLSINYFYLFIMYQIIVIK